MTFSVYSFFGCIHSAGSGSRALCLPSSVAVTGCTNECETTHPQPQTYKRVLRELAECPGPRDHFQSELPRRAQVETNKPRWLALARVSKLLWEGRAREHNWNAWRCSVLGKKWEVDTFCNGWRYEILLREAALGLTSWHCRIAQPTLGSVAFVCAALEYDWPFFAPLYAISARHATNTLSRSVSCSRSRTWIRHGCCSTTRTS